MKEEIRIGRNSLEQFVAGVFSNLGLSSEEAADSAEILVAADARGIPSHGVARAVYRPPLLRCRKIG